MSAPMIRLANIADIPAITCCAEQAYEKYVGRIGKKPMPMVQNFGKAVAEGIVWVIEADNAFAGYLIAYEKTPGSLHVENVAVPPEHQGKGLGKRLLAFAEDLARMRGLPQIDLYTNEKMTENLSVYPRLGFIEVDRREEHGFARIYYEKRLDGA